MLYFYFGAGIFLAFVLGFLVGVNVNILMKSRKKGNKELKTPERRQKEPVTLSEYYKSLPDVTKDFYKKIKEIDRIGDNEN